MAEAIVSPSTFNRSTRTSSRTRRFWLGTAAAVCAVALTGCGGAQAPAGARFPTRPVELVNPWPAGGSHDAHARAIGAEAKKFFGQPMMVSIKAGGAGAVGTAYVARQARPDGHTLLLGDQTSVIVRPMTEKLPYTWKDLRPVAQINQSPILFVVPADRPWKTLAEFIADAKRRPGGLKYGSVTGLGPDQVPVAMFLQASGVNLRHVPFEGGGSSYRAALAGDVDMAPLFPATVVKDVKEGRLRALAVTSPQRLSSLPDVPTLKESGFAIEWEMFRTVFAPARTPDATVAALRADFEAQCKDESFKKIISGLGEQVQCIGGPELTVRIERDAQTLEKLVKEMS